MCVRNCKKKFFLNECFGNKIGFGNLCNQEFKEKMDINEYEVRNLKSEKKMLKKKESCFEIYILKLDEFLI